MTRVSVVIPSAGRPGMLENALRSVAHQTAANQVVEVVVSENRSDRSTEAVCAKFPELPIRYRFRDRR